MDNYFLNGNLISLRKPDIEADIMQGQWHEWFNGAETTQCLIHGVYQITRESQKQLIEGELNNSRTLILSNVSNNTKKMIGVISLKSIDLLNRNAEIGIVMGFDNEPGVALEAFSLLTQHGFDRLNLLKIYGGSHEKLWNWVNTMETIGYKIERLRRNSGIRNGENYSTLLFAKIKKIRINL